MGGGGGGGGGELTGDFILGAGWWGPIWRQMDTE